MRRNRRDRFKTVLNTFPSPAQPLLQNLMQQGGMFSQKACSDLMRLLDVSLEALMIRLLPLASVFSVAPISEFQVGAVAMAGKGPAGTEMNLYLGANMEFKHLALAMSLHAEQAAVLNAWHEGAIGLKSVAVSEPPCGYCRQFLNELCDPAELVVLRPGPQGDVYQRNRLSEILPGAIAPCNLDNDNCLMALPPVTRKLKPTHRTDDPVVQAAISAAEESYAPYSGNFAGCALHITNNGIINGRYAESVAFNPSVSPFHSAILRLNQMSLEEKQTIERVVLVEKPTIIRQKDFVEMLVRSWAPGLDLEYYIVKEEER